MAENETTSHCFVANNSSNNNHSVSVGFEKSNDLLRSGVWEIKEDKCIERNDATPLLDGSNKDSVKHNKGEVVTLTSEDSQPPNFEEESNEVTEAVTPNSSDQLLGGKSSEDHKLRHSTEKEVGKDNRIEPPVQGKSDEPTEPVPGSSNEPVKQETSDGHTVWLPSTAIKAETEDSEESEDEVGEEERLEEGSDAEMNDDSNGGAYHLAEVSYGDENEDSQKAEGLESDSVLGIPLDNKKSASPRLEPSDDVSSLASKEKLASDFILQRKNFKVINVKSGKVHYKNFECLICGYQAPQRSCLLDHIHKHTGEKIHHCLHCDKKFRYKSYLAQHIMIHHTDFKAQFSCQLCGRRFAKESAFQRHERTHSGERPFPCTYCEYQARHRGALKEHLRVHTGEKPYECDKCGYKCAYSTLLKRHYAKYHEEKTFACQSCDYVTKQMRNLTDHLKTHSNDKFYHCDKCSYKSIRKDSLKAHITHVHSNEVLSCAVCKAKFKYTKALNKHTYEHHPDKFPFTCELCNLRFKRPRGLALHNRKRHPDVVPSS